ncbi:MAG: hypothetical protein KU38_09190 [Sulfurovum sp. FS08-3]|nr:MAG: hypothetical protein KU38_09190 [Sulfurovum sp. FS08-3]
MISLKHSMIWILGAMVVGLLNINWHLKVSLPLEFKTKMANLEKQNRQLKDKTASLQKQNKTISQKFKNYRIAKTDALLKRVKYKLSTAPAKALPVVATAAMITTTIDDIHDLCNDVQDMNNLEKELLATQDSALDTLPSICKLDIEAYIKSKMSSF